MKRQSTRMTILAASLLFCVPWQLRGDVQGSSHMMPFDEDTIAYSKSKDTGLVARLQQSIEKGELKRKYDPAYGYLLPVLRELKVSTNSQMLVFSKTSFQRDHI